MIAPDFVIQACVDAAKSQLLPQLEFLGERKTPEQAAKDVANAYLAALDIFNSRDEAGKALRTSP